MSPAVTRLITLGIVLALGIGGSVGAFALGASELSLAILTLSGGILVPGPLSAPSE